MKRSIRTIRYVPGALLLFVCGFSPLSLLSQPNFATNASGFPASSVAISAAESTSLAAPDSATADPAVLPAMPEPSPRNREDREGVPWQGKEIFGFGSRAGIGADVGPLGIGIKGAVILTPAIDARMDVNFFSYQSGNFKINEWTVAANLHLNSAGAKVDFYPFNSIWRISPGIMFVNGNQLSGKGSIAGGSSFDINGKTYFSAKENPLTGATPLNGTGTLGFHANRPAFTVSGGFGRFIPRSHRHWSFPSEFGVVFTGAPTIDVKMAGWACTDFKETQCGDVSSSSNPIGADFNSHLNTALARWRRDLNVVQIYPIFTYGVMYSFTLPR